MIRGARAPRLRQPRGGSFRETVPAVGALIFLTLALAGCVNWTPPPALAPVGPPIFHASAPRAEDGILVVLTPFEPVVTDADQPCRESYEILSEAGALVRAVPRAREPVRVLLPVGNYRVRATVAGYGMITVPVELSSLRTTTVHLDGRANYLREKFPGKALVSLPDGRIIGFRGSGR